MLQRSKDAALGLGITLLPIAALACMQFLLAPYTVATLGLMDPEIEDRAVSSLRGGIPRVYAVIALIVAAYWLLVATLGRGRFLRIRSANIALALSVLTFAFIAVMVSTNMRLENFFKGLCPLLGLPAERPDLSFDGQTDFPFDDRPTPCAAFADGAEPIVLLGLLLLLFVTSATLRIVVSRRRIPLLPADKDAEMDTPNR